MTGLQIMEDFEYCTACLETAVKMQSFNTKFISTTFGERFMENLKSPSFPNILREGDKIVFCFECAAVLHKFVKFRSQCHRAQDVLSQLRQDNIKLTKKDLQNVNRAHSKLLSTLVVTPTETISFKHNEDQITPEESTKTNDIKPSTDCNIINNVEIDSIKSEEQDVDESAFDQHEENLNDTHNYYLNENTTDEQIHKIYTKKTSKKELKSKKRKRQETLLHSTKDIESVSDDEPLANKVSKSTRESELNGTIKRNSCKTFNISYFEDYATVVFLTPEDAKKELLLRKESSNYIVSPFKCHLCYRGYETKGTFENHMKKHNTEYGKFVCDVCHLRFSEQRGLCKHRLSSHKRKFCCKLCPYVCFCTHQAKTHVSLHKGQKYPCKECGELFSMPNSLLMHKRLKHVTECVCALCGDTFATPRGLYSHHMKVHRQEKNEKLGPRCEECSLHFATEEAWKRHLVLSSKHHVSNGCKFCGETFSSTEELKSHTRRHARKQINRSGVGKLPATCVLCDKYLVNRAEYKDHMTSSHPLSEIAMKLDSTPFVCELCGLAFKKQCFLTYHQRKHTGERPYACAECNKTFQQAGARAAHAATHAPRRAHACRLCDRVFTAKSALNKHMKIHLNIRPHRCDICDKSFISPCDVRLHIKYVHNKVPWPKRDRTKRTQDPTFKQY